MKGEAMSLTNPAWVIDKARAIEGNAEFSLDARHAQFSFLLQSDDSSYVVDVNRGTISVTTEPTAANPWDFAVRATTDSWDKFIAKDADAEYRDALGMAFQGLMSVSGDIKSRLTLEGNYKKLFANLQPLYVFLTQLQINN
jgi:hypothetical protein